ncbi:MAG: SDR family oxidoreductase [Acidimicrobiia bacterium]
MIDTPPRVVLITGCSSGIGMASALAFAGAGDIVVATMRNLDKATALRAALDAAGIGEGRTAGTAAIARLDVSDESSVAAAVQGVLDEHGRIDVLVSNAGVLYEGTTEELPVEAFTHSLDVNFLGTVRMIKAVMPSMRAAGRGNIIAVSSTAGILGQPFNDAYCASKFALEGMCESLFPVAAAFGVHVSMVEPGPVTTEFVANSSTAAAKGIAGPYADVRSAFARIQAGAYVGAPQSDEIAAQIVAVADDPSPKLRYQTSEAITKLVALKLKDVTGERVTSMTSKWLT